MAAGPFTYTNVGRTLLLDGTFDINSDTWKCALFRSTSNIGSGSTTFALLSDECNTGGYVGGGVSITLGLSGTTTVTTSGSTVSWTASGTSLVARFAVIYEVGGSILGYFLLDDTPADSTTTVGNQLQVTFPTGVFTLA